MIHPRISKLFHAPTRVLPARQAYDLWASTYDEQPGNALLFIEEKFVLPILRKIDLKGLRVIDFGCGAGRYLRRMASRGAAFSLGVDFSHRMLQTARKSLVDHEAVLAQAGLEALPIRSETFDVGLCTLVLGGIPNLTKAVSEMSRVMKTGGTMIVSEFHPDADRRGWKRTFTYHSWVGGKKTLAVRNYLRSVRNYQAAFESQGMETEILEEARIDETLRPFFEKAGLGDSFPQAVGTPILFILRLRK